MQWYKAQPQLFYLEFPSPGFTLSLSLLFFNPKLNRLCWDIVMKSETVFNQF